MLNKPEDLTTDVFLVEEDRSEPYETIIDTIAAFDRREDAEAYCRSAELTGSKSEFSVRPMRRCAGPAAVYAARRNGELLGVHQTSHGAIRACMQWAGSGRPASVAVTVHRDGEESTTLWARTYSAAEAAEIRQRYLEICDRLGADRQPWAAIDALIASEGGL